MSRHRLRPPLGRTPWYSSAIAVRTRCSQCFPSSCRSTVICLTLMQCDTLPLTLLRATIGVEAIVTRAPCRVSLGAVQCFRQRLATTRLRAPPTESARSVGVVFYQQKELTVRPELVLFSLGLLVCLTMWQAPATSQAANQPASEQAPRRSEHPRPTPSTHARCRKNVDEHCRNRQHRHRSGQL